MTPKQQKLKDFLDDKANWRPPSLTQIAKFMGYSKSAADKALRRLKQNERNAASQTNS